MRGLGWWRLPVLLATPGLSIIVYSAAVWSLGWSVLASAYLGSLAAAIVIGLALGGLQISAAKDDS